MAKLFLSKDLFVEIEDGFNYTLKKKSIVTGENARGKKPKEENIGSEKETTLGYFTGLEHVIQKAIYHKLCDTNTDKFKEVMKVLAEFKEIAKLAAEFDSKFRKSLKKD